MKDSSVADVNLFGFNAETMLRQNNNIPLAEEVERMFDVHQAEENHSPVAPKNHQTNKNQVRPDKSGDPTATNNQAPNISNEPGNPLHKNKSGDFSSRVDAEQSEGEGD